MQKTLHIKIMNNHEGSWAMSATLDRLGVCELYNPRTGLVLVLNEGIAFPIHKNCNVKIRLLVQNTDLTLFGDI